MKILSNTMLALFFLLIAGLVIHGATHADGIENHQKVEHSHQD